MVAVAVDEDPEPDPVPVLLAQEQRGDADDHERDDHDEDDQAEDDPAGDVGVGHSVTRMKTVPCARGFRVRRMTSPPFELFDVDVLPSIAVKSPPAAPTHASKRPVWSGTSPSQS